MTYEAIFHGGLLDDEVHVVDEAFHEFRAPVMPHQVSYIEERGVTDMFIHHEVYYLTEDNGRWLTYTYRGIWCPHEVVAPGGEPTAGDVGE